jgi:hypothetical protein
MVNGSMMEMVDGEMKPCMYHDCIMLNGSMMMMMNGSLMECKCEMMNGMLMMDMNGSMMPCYNKPPSYWAAVRRGALPIYPAFGLQTTASDLVSIMTYIAKHHSEVFDMMTEETNVTDDHGHMITRGGAYRRTLSDGNDIYGWSAWPRFGKDHILEFSLTAGVSYSKVQELAVAFIANSLMDPEEMAMWVEKAYLTVNAASLIAEFGPRRNCQSYVNQDMCEMGPECKWIKPLTVQAAGGICVKSVAVAVKIVHPSANLSPLNLRDL